MRILKTALVALLLGIPSAICAIQFQQIREFEAKNDPPHVTYDNRYVQERLDQTELWEETFYRMEADIVRAWESGNRQAQVNRTLQISLIKLLHHSDAAVRKAAREAVASDSDLNEAGLLDAITKNGR